MRMNTVNFQTDGGPWVMHNQPCAVKWREKKAVYDMRNNVFAPSWDAQDEGWMLIKATGWRALAIRWLCQSKGLAGAVE